MLDEWLKSSGFFDRIRMDKEKTYFVFHTKDVQIKKNNNKYLVYYVKKNFNEKNLKFFNQFIQATYIFIIK